MTDDRQPPPRAWNNLQHGLPSRLEAITRATSELASVRALRLTRPDALEGLMLAELDWTEELHRLLYECDDD